MSPPPSSSSSILDSSHIRTGKGRNRGGNEGGNEGNSCYAVRQDDDITERNETKYHLGCIIPTRLSFDSAPGCGSPSLPVHLLSDFTFSDSNSNPSNSNSDFFLYLYILHLCLRLHLRHRLCLQSRIRIDVGMGIGGGEPSALSSSSARPSGSTRQPLYNLALPLSLSNKRPASEQHHDDHHHHNDTTPTATTPATTTLTTLLQPPTKKRRIASPFPVKAPPKQYNLRERQPAVIKVEQRGRGRLPPSWLSGVFAVAVLGVNEYEGEQEEGQKQKQ
ncbi:hypothetical protein C8J55DRAFT_252846 [Lentinula edodes]|uniref:Uncharacterized protein n=1 Tax=Lentinula lateritia TaxID=40482 RepID=A0A9W9DZ78_9AGAR|nr:hypothetical protein C8J55DRAFT_252846 [Lentinula edodes]